MRSCYREERSLKKYLKQRNLKNTSNNVNFFSNFPQITAALCNWCLHGFRSLSKEFQSHLQKVMINTHDFFVKNISPSKKIFLLSTQPPPPKKNFLSNGKSQHLS